MRTLSTLLMLMCLGSRLLLSAQTLPTDVTGYETVTVTIPASGYDADAGGTGLGAPQMARVKYNKQFPLVITSDDMGKTELTNNWAAINGYPELNKAVDLGIQPGGEAFLRAPLKKYYTQSLSQDINDYEPMTYTDNVGKTQRYRITCAIMPYELRDDGTTGYEKIDANDAKLMLRTGWSFAQHDVENSGDAADISAKMTSNNDRWVSKVGIGLKVMIEPNGNHKYLDAGIANSGICWNIFQNAATGYPFQSMSLSDWTDGTMPTTFSSKPSGGYQRIFFQGHETEWKNEIANADGSKIIFGGTHGIGDDIKEHLRTSTKVTDNAWVGSADEVWEYYHIYNNLEINNVNYAGDNLTFNVKVPTYNKNQYRELTLNIPGLTGAGAPTFSGADGSKVVTGGYNTDGGTGIGYTLNIGLENSITTHINELMAIYRDDQTNEFVKRDIQYLINQLWNGTSYQSQLDATPTYTCTVTPSLNGTPGTTLTTIKTDTNGSKLFAKPRYILSGGTLYETAANASGAKYIGSLNTASESSKSILYDVKSVSSLSTGTATPVLYVEGEDMEGVAIVGNDYDATANDSRTVAMQLASMGMGGCVVSGSPATITRSLPRGTYKVVIGYGDSNTGASSTYDVNVDGTSVYQFTNSGVTNSTVTEFTSEDFNIEIDNSPVTITSDYTASHAEQGSHWIDYVYFVKTADLEAIAPIATLSTSAVGNIKKNTSTTISAEMLSRGGTNYSGISIYQCDSEGNISGEAKATSTTSTVNYEFTPTEAGTFYFIAKATDATTGTGSSEIISVTAVNALNVNYVILSPVTSGSVRAKEAVATRSSDTVGLPDDMISPYATNYKYWKSEYVSVSGSDYTITGTDGDALSTGDEHNFTLDGETVYVTYDITNPQMFSGTTPYQITVNTTVMYAQPSGIWNGQGGSDTYNNPKTWVIKGTPYAARICILDDANLSSGERVLSINGLGDNNYWDTSSSLTYNTVMILKNSSNQPTIRPNTGDTYEYGAEGKASYINWTGDGKHLRTWYTAYTGGGINVTFTEQYRYYILNDHRQVVAKTVNNAFGVPTHMQSPYVATYTYYKNLADDGNGTYTLDDAKIVTDLSGHTQGDVYYMVYTKSAAFPATNGAKYKLQVYPTRSGNSYLSLLTNVEWADESGAGLFTFTGGPYDLQIHPATNSALTISTSGWTDGSTITTGQAYDTFMLTRAQNNASNALLRLNEKERYTGDVMASWCDWAGGLKTLKIWRGKYSQANSDYIALHRISPSVTLTTTAAATLQTRTTFTLKATPVQTGSTALASLQFQSKVTGGADGEWENIGDAITSITSGTEYTQDYTPTTAGTYSFRAVVTDANGITGASASDDATPTGDEEGLITLSVIDDMPSNAAYSYKMKATLKDGETVVDEQWLHEVESETALTDQHYFFPRYILNGATLYEVTANTPTKSDNTNNAVLWDCSYAKYRNVDGQNQRDNLIYNKVSGKDNVVFFGEAEDIEGSLSKRCPNSNNDNQFKWNSAEGRFTWFSSMGYGLRTSGSYGTVTTLQPGKYIITVGLTGSSMADTDNTHLIKFGKTEATATQVGAVQYTFTGDGNLIERSSDEFSIYSEQSVFVTHTESRNNGLDYIYIQRTGDANVSAPTITLSVEDYTNKAIETGGESLTNKVINLKATATMNGGESLKDLTFQQKTGEGEWTTISTVATPADGTEYTATFTPSETGTVYFRAFATTVVDSSTELTGNTQSDTSDLTTAFSVSVVDHLTITSYTLHIIDNEGTDVFGNNITITKAEKDGLTEGQDPLLTLRPQYASPFVSSYLYFDTAAEAQANSGTATTWDQPDIYVGYNVDASKMGADKVHAVYNSSNKLLHPTYRISQDKVNDQWWMRNQNLDRDNGNTVAANSLPFVDNTFLWSIGSDPYNVKFYNSVVAKYLTQTSNTDWDRMNLSSADGATSFSLLYYTTNATGENIALYNRTSNKFVYYNGDAEGGWRLSDSRDSRGQMVVKALPMMRVNVVNAAGEIEATMNVGYNRGASMPAYSTPFFLERAYTSGHQFYYNYDSTTKTVSNQITGTVNEATLSDIYVTYVLDKTNWLAGETVDGTANIQKVKPLLPDDEKIYWYAIRTNNNTENYLKATATSPLPTAITRTRTAYSGSVDADSEFWKLSEWAFVGTPYNLKIVERYHGITNYLGIAESATAGSRAYILGDDKSGYLTTFEVVTGLVNQSKLFFRPQSSFIDPEIPLLYLGGSDNDMKLYADISGNQAFDFTYVTNTDAPHVSTVNLTATKSNPLVDETVTLTATATPDNKDENTVSYLAIEQETSAGVWEVVSAEYEGANVTGASKDAGTGIVTVTYSFTPIKSGTYNFRAHATIDDKAQYSSDDAAEGGDGQALTITAGVEEITVGSDNYTLILVDKSGNELFTESNVSKERVEEVNSVSGRNGDPIDNSWRSPLVAKYRYYSTKADAKDNTGTNLFDWSNTAATPTVYVGYEVGNEVDLIEVDPTARQARSATDNTQVRDAATYTTMYMIKFKNGEQFKMENGSDGVGDQDQAIYPYTCGDGAMYIYGENKRQSDSQSASTTRERWPWFIVSETGDPYHVVVTSWKETHGFTPADDTYSAKGFASGTTTNCYNYLRTYYNSTVGAVVTNTISDDPRVVDTSVDGGSADNVPTVYMMLGTSHNYKLVTVDPISNGTINERRTVSTLEQYWKTYETISKNGTLSTTSNENPDFAGITTHRYQAWAYGRPISSYPPTKENKKYAYDYHFYQTVNMGEYFDLEPIDLNGVLILLDNHGWEIMRKPIATPGDEDEDEMKAAIKKYDSPMVKAYHFWETGTKVSGYHKYTVKTHNSDGTSLADYPIIRNKYKNIGDVYVTYDVKDDFAYSYTGAATAAGTSASKFVISQGGNYAKANGTAIEGVADVANADKWYLKPNFDIDKEMGYKYDLDADGKTGGTSLTEEEVNTAYHENGQSGFDPYNLQIQNVTDGTKFFTTNAVSGALDGAGGMMSTYSSDMAVTLTAGTQPAETNGEGQDNVDLYMTNATFMAVQDENGNMRLMPRFDHAHVIDGFNTLAAPDEAQPASDTTNPQSTQLTTGTITYHIIDNQGTDVFGALTHTGAGFAVAKEYRSPMVEEYYYHSSQEHATNSDTRMTSNKTSFDDGDEVWVSYKAKDEFGSATWNIWNTNGMYMHAVSRNLQDANTNLWWMSNQNQDRESNATTTTLSTSTMPFLDNSFGWLFEGAGDTPDPYNVMMLNKAAGRYIKQNDTGSNSGRMDHLQTSIAEATPYSILYYDADANNENAIMYDRTHSRYVRANGNEWHIKDDRSGSGSELVITQLPALNISVVNAAGDIDVTLQGFFKSGTTWTPFVPLYLERLHTSGQAFYYDKALTEAVATGVAVNDSKVEAKDTIFVRYTLDPNWGTLTTGSETTDVMPSPTNNKIQWYAIKTQSNAGRYFKANTDANTELTNTNVAPGDTDSDTDKLGQWAFIGTPYNLKLVNRYHGMGNYLGVPTESDEKAYVYNNEEGHITTWEVVSSLGNSSYTGLEIRPQRSFNGETPYGYVGYGGSTTGVYPNPNSHLSNVLVWLKETDAKSLIFKLYDRDGNHMADAERGGIADKTLTGYQQGDVLATVFTHTNMLRRYCEYTFYSSYDSETKEFSNPITTAQLATDETIYVKWDFTDDAPVFMPWSDASEFTPASPNPDDYQYYLMNVKVNQYSYMWGVTGDAETGYTFKVDNAVGSEKSRVHQFAFHGDPYTLKIYSRNAGKYISTNSTEAALVMDNTPDSGDEVEVVFDLPYITTESSTTMRFRRKGTNRQVVGNSTNIWLYLGEGFDCHLRDMVVPVRIFKEGETNWNADLKDYREYTVDLANVTTTSRIKDADLNASENAIGTTHDFRHAFCDYTFYRSYDWNNTLSNIIASEGENAGLPYFGGKDQYKRQFFGTYTVDEEAFGYIWFMDMKPTDNNPGWWLYKNSESTNGYTTGYMPNSGKETVVTDATSKYRWQFSGDPYDLQIHSLSMGDFKENYVLAAKTLSSSSSTAPTEDAGTLVLLTDDLKEGSSDTESYGQYSRWEIIQRSTGNYILWNIDTDERYSYCLTNQSGTGNLFVIPEPSIASQMNAVTWQLEDAVGHQGVTWHVMELTGTDTYAVVASETKVVETDAVLTLEDMPESLKRHFCEYEKMYSTLTGTTTAGTLSDDCTETGFTVTAPSNIYVTYKLNSGAPEFISEVPAGEPTGTETYWHEIHFPGAGSYIYYNGTKLINDYTDISTIRTDESTSGKSYSYYRWALVGSPYNVKFYNMATKSYATVTGTSVTMDEGTSFELLDDVYYDGELCLIHDAGSNTNLFGNGGMSADRGAWASAEFSNANGVVKIQFVLHYSDKTLRKRNATDGDEPEADELDNETEGNAAGTTEIIDITTFQKLDKALDEVFPSHWRRAFCDYSYYWQAGTTDATPIANITTTQTAVTKAMVDAYNEEPDQPIYIHVTYDYKTHAPFQWSVQDGENSEYNWYYLVNNHRPSGEQGKMVYRDSSPKLRVSTALVDNRLYLNNFEWCVIGDPYGFKMLNHYDPDHRFDEYISVTDTKESYGGIGYQLEQEADNKNCLFEMMPGHYDYNFWMHPIYTSTVMDEYTDEMSYVGNNANGSAAIIPDVPRALTYLQTNSSANFRLEILSDATLKEYLNYAGFVGALKYEVANATNIEVDGNSVNVAAIKEKIINGTATEEEKTIIHNLINDPDNVVQMEQGYYRIIPYEWENNSGGRHYLRGYLYGEGTTNSIKEIARAATDGSKGLTANETPAEAEYDPASVFWFEATEEDVTGYPRYEVMTQGMHVKSNIQTTGAGFDIRYEDLGAAITQLKVNNSEIAEENYLSAAATERATVNHCFDEQAGAFKTRFYLQKVGDANDSEMPLKKSCTFASGNKFEDEDFYYTSLYVPFDVILPDGAVAFIGVKENRSDPDNYILRSWSMGWFDERVHEDDNGVVIDNDRYIPAGTAVVIRLDKTKTSGESPWEMTLQLRDPQTAPALVTERNRLLGSYLTTYCSGLADDELVYVFTKSNKGNIGIYMNKTNVPDGYSGMTTNTYIQHNKIYYIYKLDDDDSGGGGSAPAKAMLMSFESSKPDLGGVTDIEQATKSNHATADDHWYTLQGVRLDGQPTQRGVYIHGGRKVIIKSAKEGSK